MPRLTEKRPSIAFRGQRHRSVSLEHDHRAATPSRPYVLTGCANRAIRRVLEGISNPSGARAWTLTGPFGTGKSSFGLFLSHLLTPASSTSGREARQTIANADPSLHVILQAALPRGKGFVPIVVTGSREPLSVALSRAITTALKASKTHGALRLAKEISETATDGRRDPIKTLHKAIDCLTADNAAAGILIVIDELGKLLEYAAAHPKMSDVYLLQQLAEYAARSEVPTLLLGILHQDFAGYAEALPDSDRREWEKVRGRFEDIVFEQSADDMLRLIAEAMSVGADHTSPGANEKHSKFVALCKGAWLHKLVPPGLELSNGLTLLTQCHPLHPAATLLLGPVFKRFGQNERSAFSFLTSGEPHALPDFVTRSKDDELYSIVHLFEYLLAVFGDALLSSRDGKRWAEAFNVESQHPDLSGDELRLLRTIALLGIVGRWNGVAPTPATLQYALTPEMNPAELDRTIKALLAKSAIVYRRFNNTYSLWEGSDIDVEARIADMRSQIAADTSIVQLLATHFAPRPLLARRHSYEFGTLRYFDVVFATLATLQDVLTRFDAAPESARADGQIFVVLPATRAGPVNPNDPLLQAITARPDIIVCVPGNARELDSLARELAAIERVQAATTDLQHDATARRELSTRREETHGRLQQTVGEVLTPTRASGIKTRWYRSGNEEPLISARALNEFLSTVCDDLFKDAPKINNEIINRRELSSSAAAAQGNLIDGMIARGDVEELGIQLNPPERSIYLSVLQALGLHAQRDGKWVFAANEKQVRKDAQKVFAEIRRFFDEAKEAPVALDVLFRRLRRRPYGLRGGVIPIFVCAALIGNESNVALYDDEGAFQPELTSAIFDQIIKAPARYKIRRWHVSGVRVAVFEQLGKMLGRTPIDLPVEAKDLLDVVKPLVRFVRKLNDFTMKTKAFAPVTIAVRSAIASASEPDTLLFHDLPIACGVDGFTSSKKNRTSDVEQFLRALQSALAELQRGYDVLLQNLHADLATAFELATDETNARKLLATRAEQIRGIALNPDIKVFIGRIIDVSPDDSEWVEQLAAFLANKHPTIWLDDDRARFSVRLSQMAEAFRALESLAHSRKGVPGIDDDHESIRIAVVGTHSAQSEQVVHLNRRESSEVSELQSRIQMLFQPYAVNGSRKLAIAALAKVAQELFARTDATHLASTQRKTK
jgi:hypothetical protein